MATHFLPQEQLVSVIEAAETGNVVLAILDLVLLCVRQLVALGLLHEEERRRCGRACDDTAAALTGWPSECGLARRRGRRPEK